MINIPTTHPQNVSLSSNGFRLKLQNIVCAFEVQCYSPVAMRLFFPCEVPPTRQLVNPLSSGSTSPRATPTHAVQAYQFQKNQADNGSKRTSLDWSTHNTKKLHKSEKNQEGLPSTSGSVLHNYPVGSKTCKKIVCSWVTCSWRRQKMENATGRTGKYGASPIPDCSRLSSILFSEARCAFFLWRRNNCPQHTDELFVCNAKEMHSCVINSKKKESSHFHMSSLP